MAEAVDVRSMHIPPETRHVASVRSFVGAIARSAGCSQETIEDLRLAVTEACGYALEHGAAPDGIDLQVWVEGGRLIVEVVPVGTFGRADGAEGVPRWALIEALFPDAEHQVRDGTGVLRFTAASDHS